MSSVIQQAANRVADLWEILSGSTGLDEGIPVVAGELDFAGERRSIQCLVRATPRNEPPYKISVTWGSGDIKKTPLLVYQLSQYSSYERKMEQLTFAVQGPVSSSSRGGLTIPNHMLLPTCTLTSPAAPYSSMSQPSGRMRGTGWLAGRASHVSPDPGSGLQASRYRSQSIRLSQFMMASVTS